MTYYDTEYSTGVSWACITALILTRRCKIVLTRKFVENGTCPSITGKWQRGKERKQIWKGPIVERKNSFTNVRPFSRNRHLRAEKSKIMFFHWNALAFWSRSENLSDMRKCCWRKFPSSLMLHKQSMLQRRDVHNESDL